jgi:hypothetical protein
MVTFWEILENARKTFKEHERVVEENKKVTKSKGLQEFLTCHKRDRQGLVSQVKQVVLPPINDTIEVIPNMGTSSPSITYENVFGMFANYGKTMKTQMQHMIEEGLAKSFRNLNISFDSPTTRVGQHTSNSSATQVL